MDSIVKGEGGFVTEQTLGNLCSNQLPGTVPVYRVREPVSNWHMTTTIDGESNWISEGIKGYAFSSPVPGTVPVYRKAKASGDHLTTLDPNEASPTYVTDFGGKPMMYLVA